MQSARLLDRLHEYARTHGGQVLDSPLDIVFSEYDVLQSDVVFFQTSRQHLIQADAAIRSAPDLAVDQKGTLAFRVPRSSRIAVETLS